MTQQDALGKGEATRLRILQASIDVFGRNGFFEASLAEIAKKVKISQAAILKHYPSKTRVFEAGVHEVLRTNHEIVSDLLGPEVMGLRGIECYIEGNVQWARKHPHQARMILLLYYLASFDEVFTSLYGNILKISRARIERFVLEAARTGELEMEDLRERKILSEAIQELVLGSLLNLVTAGRSTKISSEEMIRKVRMLVASHRARPSKAGR